jgi:hypothetical protein
MCISSSNTGSAAAVRAHASPECAELRGPALGADVHHAPPNAAPASSPAMSAAVSGGSRRRRLWELPAHCHCPVLGVSLPMALLRKRVGKALDVRVTMDDYALHVRCVHECKRRTPVSEALQRELDLRSAAALRRFAAAKSADAVLALWQDAVRGGDIAQALWAALSHPRCDAATTEHIYGDAHMIQHQAGALRRGDQQQIEARLREGAEAARELAQLQQRQHQAQADRAAELDRLQGQLLRARAELIGRDSLLAAAHAELAELRQAVPDLASRSALAERLAEMTERNRELARQLAERSWAREGAGAVAAAQTPCEPQTASQDEPGGLGSHGAPAAALVSPSAEGPQAQDLAPIDLGAKAVLCVGGRNGVVAIYRDLVERHGGRFAHHDGGLEHTARQLDASLAAADLVICQTGCISHNAYWLVKSHCKRTGKRCVYLDKPSASSFAKGLQQVPASAPEVTA